MIIRRIAPEREQRKLRVAAYARVSTETEEQTESYETQVDYYTRLIRQNANWEYVDVYADRKSATSAQHRPEFQRMMADGREKKFDILLVKAISRFARNVVDAQHYVHELKQYDVEVRFENESISSADPTAEMMFNILAIIAQQESKNKSENVRWTYQKLAEQGIRHIGNHRVLGYDEVKGKLTPNGDAWIVKLIFEQYAEGISISRIIKNLDTAGAKRARCDQPFNPAIIGYILKNEVYRGDRMLQKAAPHNYLTKKPDITQPYTSYYIKADHEAIIGNDTWNKVQARLLQTQDERLDGIHKRETAHFLYGKVFCSRCGAPYTRRTVRGKGGMQKVWKCLERLKGKNGNGCQAGIISEDELLRLISERLGWEWTDADHFDVTTFLSSVKSVDITEKGIRVLKRKAA
ncbi:MAG: recombinase family protein [Raoultibacter sp.]